MSEESGTYCTRTAVEGIGEAGFEIGTTERVSSDVGPGEKGGHHGKRGTVLSYQFSSGL